MGTVYRALDLQTQQSVAVKLLTLDEELSAERFAREASVLSAVSHPGIVGYVSHGTFEGHHYLVMEWIEGETLTRVLDSPGLNIADTLALAVSVGQALQELHARGVVHRDIKPANLMFPGGALASVKVLDLGLARKGKDASALTRTGLMVGSPGYMSPEQARGQREITPQADVFSLGCVLYECLTGQPAFQGPDALSIRSKVLMVDPKPTNELNAEVPPRLASLVQQMMAKAPHERPLDGSEVAQAAQAIPAPKVSAQRRRGRSRLDSQTALLGSAIEGGSAPPPNVPGPLSDGEGAGPSARLTSQFVILVGAEGDNVPPPPEALREAVTANGGTLEVLESGQVLAVLSGTEDPSIEASRAARLALRLRMTLPELPMTLVADCSRRPSLGELIERGVQSIQLEAMEALFVSSVPGGVEPGGIRLDAQAQRLIEQHFRVQQRRNAAYLLGELLPGTGA
jgi:serine/threonine protein kinase